MTAGQRKYIFVRRVHRLYMDVSFLNFSRSSSEMDLITRRVIARLEGTEDVSEEVLEQYTDPESEKYDQMVEEIRKELNFTSLRFNRLDDMLEAVGIPKEKTLHVLLEW